MATPTKTVSRANVSPKTKELQCLICFQKVERADYRRKLFTSKGKTNACHDLELILGEELLTDDQQPSTNTVCRNCTTRNSNYVKQILSVRQKYKDTLEILKSRGQVTSVKRMCRPETTERTSSKRPPRQLFEDETERTTFPLNNSETCGVSTVMVYSFFR